MYRKLFIGLNLFLSIILGIVFNSLSIFAVNLIMLVLLLFIVNKEDDRIFKRISLLFVICIVAILLVYLGYNIKYGEPYYIGGSDDRNFEIWGQEVIDANDYTIQDVAQNSKFRYYNCIGFIWFMSYLIRFCNFFGGYHTIILRLINIYLLIGMAVLVYKYLTKQKDFCLQDDNKSILLYLMVLFPNALYISVHGFRDNIFAFILFSIFYLTSRLNKRNIFSKVLIIIYVIMSMYFIYYVRVVGVIYIGLIIIINLLIGDKTIKDKKSIFKFLLLFAVFIVAVVKLDLINESAKYLDRYNDYILGNNSGLSNIVFSTPIFPFGIVLRFIYGLIFPAPTGIMISSFDIDGICNFLVSIGTIFQIYMLPYLFKNIKKIDGVFIIFLGIFVSIIFTTFNFRHFLTIYPYMLILIYRQYCVSNNKTKNNYIFIMTCSLLFIVTLYLILQVM